MSTLKLENIKHESSSTNNMVMNSDGSVSATSIKHASSSTNNMVMNSDGSISATSVGKIGKDGNDFYVTGSASNIAGVYLANSKAMPMKSGVVADGQSDLGSSSYRWKDLYLSGGVYVGGTASAHHIDDYETGSFQMSMTGESSGAVLGYGTYVKIGNICHFNWYSGTRTINSTVNGVLTGLPFNHTSPYGSGGAYASVIFSHNTWVNDAATGYINIGTNSIYPTRNNSSGANQTSQGSKYVMCSGSYYVN